MLSQLSLNFKSETFIKTNGRRVVSVDFELESRKIEPVVCEIDDRAHEFFANAFALPVLVYRDSNCSGVFAARLIWKRNHTHHSDYAAFDDPHEVIDAIGVLRQSPPPLSTRRT